MPAQRHEASYTLPIGQGRQSGTGDRYYYQNSRRERSVGGGESFGTGFHGPRDNTQSQAEVATRTSPNYRNSKLEFPVNAEVIDQRPTSRMQSELESPKVSSII